MKAMPSGWEYPSIDEILEPQQDGRLIHQGWSPQCERHPRVDNTIWAVLKTTAVQSGAFLPHEHKQLPSTLKPRPALEVAEGDLLMTCAGPRSRCGIACLVRRTEPRLMFSGKIYRFRVNRRLADPRFVEAMLLSPDLVQSIDAIKTGGSDSGLNLTHERFRSLRVPLPPVAEQARIVESIEEAFSKLDAGEAALRTVRQRLKRMRDAILVAAVSGYLLPQDPTETALIGGLPKLAAPSTDGWYAIPTTWTWAKLGDLLREPLRNGVSAVSADPANGLPTFSITAVTTGDFSSRNIKFTVADREKASDLWAERGDIFVQRSNTPELVGTARLYRGIPRAAVFPDLLIRVRTVAEVRPGWTEIAMSSPFCRQFVRSQAKGLAGSMPKISQPTLEKLPIPVPPSGEQDRIIAEVERQFSVLDACERAVEAGLERSEALRRAVLKVAFEGRLVPQDPSDLSASVSLQRIRAERAASGPAKSGRGRKKVETL